ncbi:MAG: rod shape-determining protein MreD [Chloroflexi bacterium]|nr:MAG: rod shape-determining protein MreD [Chloroflexota bacterium]
MQPGIYTGLWLMPVLALLQSSLASRLEFRGVLPGFVLVTVVSWGILRGLEEGLVWAFVGGVSLDVLSGLPFGTNTVAMVVTAGVVSLGEGTFIRTHALLPLMTVFGATILYYVIVLFILQSTQQPVDWLAALRTYMLPTAIYNALMSILVFWLARRLESRIYRAPRAHW